MKKRFVLWCYVLAALAGTVVAYRSAPSWPMGALVGTVAILWALAGWLGGRLILERHPPLPLGAQLSELTAREPQSTQEEQTKKTNQAASQFLRHLMHELKRPVASLQQSIYLLSDEAQGPLTAEQKRILEIQLRSAHRIASCIENLGDLFQLEEGGTDYRLESQDLIAIIGDVVRRFDLRLRERKLQVQFEFSARPLLMDCDKGPISRALGHIVENAVKFSPAGGTIIIKAEHLLELPAQSPRTFTRLMSEAGSAKGFAMVTVADSGPGIPDSQRSAIFERFYQIRENSEAYQQGLGIGLTICSNIVKAHHGTVWVESNPAGGSLFFLLLPVASDENAIAYRVKSVS